MVCARRSVKPESCTVSVAEEPFLGTEPDLPPESIERSSPVRPVWAGVVFPRLVVSTIRICIAQRARAAGPPYFEAHCGPSQRPQFSGPLCRGVDEYG